MMIIQAIAEEKTDFPKNLLRECLQEITVSLVIRRIRFFNFVLYLSMKNQLTLVKVFTVTFVLQTSTLFSVEEGFSECKILATVNIAHVKSLRHLK